MSDVDRIRARRAPLRPPSAQDGTGRSAEVSRHRIGVSGVLIAVAEPGGAQEADFEFDRRLVLGPASTGRIFFLEPVVCRGVRIEVQGAVQADGVLCIGLALLRRLPDAALSPDLGVDLDACTTAVRPGASVDFALELRRGVAVRGSVSHARAAAVSH